MGVVPATRVGKIDFYEAHLAPWTTSAAAIGLLPASVVSLTELVSAARKAYGDHLAAQEAAKAATQAFYDKVRFMHSNPGAGADMIDTIKTYAATTNNPNVFVLAQVPAPSQGGVAPPPGTPFDFTVGLLQDGSVELKWKCNNPSGTVGTVYEVLRKSGSGGFGFVGMTGIKAFTDGTIPAGSAPVTYMITAIRSTSRGNPAQFIVNFGVGGGGGISIASVTQAPIVKMAA